MEYRTLSEIKDDYEYVFNTKMPRDYENSPIVTASHCFDAFLDGSPSYEITEEIVCILLIGTQIKKHGNRIFIGQYKLLMDAIEKVENSAVILDLTETEKEEVNEMAEVLKKALPIMEIEYNPFSK